MEYNYKITITRESKKSLEYPSSKVVDTTVHEEVYSQSFDTSLDVRALVRMINFNASRASEEPSIEDGCEVKDRSSSDAKALRGEGISAPQFFKGLNEELNKIEEQRFLLKREHEHQRSIKLIRSIMALL